MQEGPVSETARHFLCQLEVQGCLACAPAYGVIWGFHIQIF